MTNENKHDLFNKATRYMNRHKDIDGITIVDETKKNSFKISITRIVDNEPHKTINAVGFSDSDQDEQ